VAPAVWLAEFLSEVNEHFAMKQLARSEFYSTALSDSVDVVWEYHAWRQAMVGTCLPFITFTVTLHAFWVAGCHGAALLMKSANLFATPFSGLLLVCKGHEFFKEAITQVGWDDKGEACRCSTEGIIH